MIIATDGKNRTKPSTAIYRAMMEAIEARRVELGLSMATVNDMAGTQDGFYGKMIYPDTPHGRQARWETVQDVVEAVFGRGFRVQIVPDETENSRVRGAPRIDEAASANARTVRHWRHTRYFREIGSKGGKAFFAGKDKDERSKILQLRAKKRWRAARKALRQAAEHRDRQEAQKAAAAKKPVQQHQSTPVAERAANLRAV